MCSSTQNRLYPFLAGLVSGPSLAWGLPTALPASALPAKGRSKHLEATVTRADSGFMPANTASLRMRTFGQGSRRCLAES